MESSAACRLAAGSRQMASWLLPSWPRHRALIAAGLAFGRLACWLLGLATVLALAGPTSALADADRFEVSLIGRTLGYRDLREPTSFTPSAAFVPQQGGWVRNWTEQRGYVEAVYRLLETRQVVLALGGQVGASVGRFEAKNVAQGVYEAWETRPAFLWGPCARLILRRQPGEGIFARFDYAFFSAAAPETREEGANRSGGGTPPSARDAFFSWTSHEATARLGYDFGPVEAAAGASLVAFRLDKRLTHHADPTGATGNALAAILALNALPSRYGYEPRSLVVPFLSLAVRPAAGLALEGSIRPTDQPDVALRLTVSF
ncbi:MAG: hypothetical protein B193_0438 [Solidesulfovibrio magneticus str. Maddingley MBC34]|uniref:Uncharacterized protein n=1 Tax=Solidesulfovibrio magneticus str. Maddingley MBC34 TaxID=1206767 RepID=K6FQJ6_9BACT|nr:MAG: hypothetical protein B193_0438 [Solidesulfovibrio magneticus str. Maddingley MBC34]